MSRSEDHAARPGVLTIVCLRFVAGILGVVALAIGTSSLALPTAAIASASEHASTSLTLASDAPGSVVAVPRSTQPAATTLAAATRSDATGTRPGQRTSPGSSTPSESRSSAAKAGDDVADVAANAARVARQPSTPWGRTIQSFRDNPDDWRRLSAHAEEATGKSYRGGVSIEEIFERGSDRLVRHRIYGPQGDILHETFRPYAKFGAP